MTLQYFAYCPHTGFGIYPSKEKAIEGTLEDYTGDPEAFKVKVGVVTHTIDSGALKQINPDVYDLLLRARSCVDYQMGAQNLNIQAGRDHATEFAKLLSEIDRVLL